MIAEIFRAYWRALNQLDDPSFRKVCLAGLFGGLGVLAILWTVIDLGLASIDWASIPYLGDLVGWLGDSAGVLASWLYGSLVLVLSYFLFAPVMTAVVGLFLEQICDAVEMRHFPHLGPVRSQSLVASVTLSFKFLGLVILVNLLLLLLYLPLLLVAGAGLLLYYLVNGYLVGREYFQLVAYRRLGEISSLQLARKHRGRLTGFGVVFMLLMTIPIVNLIAPVLAAAAMVHFFEGLPSRKDYPDEA